MVAAVFKMAEFFDLTQLTQAWLSPTAMEENFGAYRHASGCVAAFCEFCLPCETLSVSQEAARLNTLIRSARPVAALPVLTCKPSPKFAPGSPRLTATPCPAVVLMVLDLLIARQTKARWMALHTMANTMVCLFAWPEVSRAAIDPLNACSVRLG